MTATTATVVDCRANTAQAAKDTHPAAGRCAAHKGATGKPRWARHPGCQAQGRRVVDSPGQHPYIPD